MSDDYVIVLNLRDSDADVARSVALDLDKRIGNAALYRIVTGGGRVRVLLDRPVAAKAHPYENYSAYPDQALALAAEDPFNEEALAEVLERLDLPLDETEQGLTPAATLAVEKWIAEAKEQEPPEPYLA